MGKRIWNDQPNRPSQMNYPSAEVEGRVPHRISRYYSTDQFNHAVSDTGDPPDRLSNMSALWRQREALWTDKYGVPVPIAVSYRTTRLPDLAFSGGINNQQYTCHQCEDQDS